MQIRTVRTGQGTRDWFQIGKGVHQGCILPLCLFNLDAECIMRNVRLDKEQAGTNFLLDTSITSDMKMTPSCGKK